MKNNLKNIVEGALIIIFIAPLAVAYGIYALLTGMEELEKRRRARILNKR